MPERRKSDVDRRPTKKVSRDDRARLWFYNTHGRPAEFKDTKEVIKKSYEYPSNSPTAAEEAATKKKKASSIWKSLTGGM